MEPREEDRLSQTLQQKLDQGYAIGIIGWKDSNHDDFTRGLPPDKVLFLERAPTIIPKVVGYALATRFVDHAEMKRIKRQGPTHTHLISTGAIKRILQKTELGRPQPATPPPSDRSQKMGSSALPDPTGTPVKLQALPDAVTETSDEERRIAFAKEFLTATNNDPEVALSKYQATEIARKHFGDKASASHFPDLLSPMVGEGNTKAGSYKATEELLELATGAEVEPRDPIEKARWLIGRKPRLEGDRDRLQIELKRVARELERVDKAHMLLEQLKGI